MGAGGGVNQLSGVVTGVTTAQAPAAVQFEAAKSAAAQRSATSLSAADAASGYASVGRSDNVTKAGNVTFVLRDSVWTDVRYKKSGTVLQVKPFSDAYFKLIEMLPDLREPFSVGERVIIVGRSMAIELTQAGKERLNDGDVTLLRDRW
jgi:hypothetical protein